MSVCILCNGIGLYRAQDMFFCKHHRKEAIEATAKDKRLALSRMAVDDELAPHERRRVSTIQPWTGFRFEK